jgi:hypothetical protein
MYQLIFRVFQNTLLNETGGKFASVRTKIGLVRQHMQYSIRGFFHQACSDISH